MIKRLNANGKEVKMGDADKIQTGDKILLCLSRGPRQIQVKDTYRNFKYGDVEKELKDKGLDIEREDEYNSSVPAGNVISTSYSCSYEENEIEESQQGGIHEGDSVVVTVSAGPEPEPTTQASEPTQPSSGGGSSSSRSSSKTSGGKKPNSGSTSNSTKKTSKPKTGFGGWSTGGK